MYSLCFQSTCVLYNFLAAPSCVGSSICPHIILAYHPLCTEPFIYCLLLSSCLISSLLNKPFCFLTTISLFLLCDIPPPCARSCRRINHIQFTPPPSFRFPFLALSYYLMSGFSNYYLFTEDCLLSFSGVVS